MKGQRLFAITGPDEVEVSILGYSALDALFRFHGEGVGFNRVAIVDGRLWFRRRADRELCAGRWTVTEQATNGTAVATTEIEIPESE